MRPAVEWGVRINCYAVGCDRSVTVWSKGSTPCMPRGDSTPGHWFIMYRQHGELHEAGDWRRGHVVFCPDHSRESLTWEAEFKTWKEQRWRAGQDAAKHFLHPVTLRDWCRGTIEVDAQALHYKVGATVREWVKNNPPPVPPWKHRGV